MQEKRAGDYSKVSDISHQNDETVRSKREQPKEMTKDYKGTDVNQIEAISILSGEKFVPSHDVTNKEIISEMLNNVQIIKNEKQSDLSLKNPRLYETVSNIEIVSNHGKKQPHALLPMFSSLTEKLSSYAASETSDIDFILSISDSRLGVKEAEKAEPQTSDIDLLLSNADSRLGEQEAKKTESPENIAPQTSDIDLLLSIADSKLENKTKSNANAKEMRKENRKSMPLDIKSMKKHQSNSIDALENLQKKEKRKSTLSFWNLISKSSEPEIERKVDKTTIGRSEKDLAKRQSKITEKMGENSFKPLQKVEPSIKDETHQSNIVK